MPKSEQTTEDEEWLPDASEQQQQQQQQQKGRSNYVKEEADTSSGHGESHSGDSSEVKTKFPVARIKRIMQADEDVGKVAQVTPVVVCKFIISSFIPYLSPRRLDKGATARQYRSSQLMLTSLLLNSKSA